MIKNTELSWFAKEALNFQLRGDFFNLANIVKLTPVEYNPASPNFGRSLDTFQPRVIQLGARLEF